MVTFYGVFFPDFSNNFQKYSRPVNSIFLSGSFSWFNTLICSLPGFLGPGEFNSCSGKNKNSLNPAQQNACNYALKQKAL